ncbi:CoA pyrophosphatase [Sphingomicrobium flavum]|uniref:CoA pyrophosphatase n=1 Tax=Sphingomicrobium flavum TaxID=1229164 RepID=UPI0021ADE7E0|nr:CoA pyrophosphatase [Sphingomicrobium flavum]
MTLEERLRAAIAAPRPLEVSQDDMDRHELGETCPAAVLVPVIERLSPTLLLTQRAGDMRTHAGQIAFPGGRIDPGETPADAALREAEEELGIPRSTPQPLGFIDSYRTGTGFYVAPLIAILPPDLPIIPQPDEVADWFEAPLDLLIDPANHSRESVEWKGRLRHYWRIHFEDRYIWGATAGMIVNLSHRLRHAL